jgi:hypothetical protein
MTACDPLQTVAPHYVILELLKGKSLSDSHMAWSIREIWRTAMAGYSVGRVEYHAEANNIVEMRRYAKKALKWAEGPYSRFGAHVANATVEALDGQTDLAKHHVQAAHKCIEEEPEIRGYRELRDAVAEYDRLEELLHIRSES